MTHWIKCLPFKYERYSFDLHIPDESTWGLWSAIIPVLIGYKKESTE